MFLAMFIIAVLTIASSLLSCILLYLDAEYGYDLKDPGVMSVLLSILFGVILSVLAIVSWAMSL